MVEPDDEVLPSTWTCWLRLIDAEEETWPRIRKGPVRVTDVLDFTGPDSEPLKGACSGTLLSLYSAGGGPGVVVEGMG